MDGQEREHRISLAEAVELTRRYREIAGEHSGFFPSAPVQELLAQKGCTGMRIYYGRHTDGKFAMVLVGVGEKGEDLTDGMLLDRHEPCPPYCPDESPLLK